MAVAVAASGGAGNSGSLAFGASVALNDVADTVGARMDNSFVEARGNVVLSALTTTEIGAVTLAGSGSVASGSGGSLGIAIAGAGRRIREQHRHHHGSGHRKREFRQFHIRRHRCHGGGTTAASRPTRPAVRWRSRPGPQTLVAVAVGVSVAVNEIDNTVRAGIGNSGIVRTDDLAVTASAGGTIDAVSVAAAVSVAEGTTTGVAVSGGGAVATNYMGTDVEGYLSGVIAPDAGSVTVSAENVAEVNAYITAVSAACGVSPQSGGAAAVGVSVARNFIGWSPDESTGYDFSTDLGLAQGLTLGTGDRVFIASGARAGDVYEYLGESRTQPIADYSTDDGTRTVAYGDVVFICEDFEGNGTTGGLYRYLGDGAAIDLSSADYTGDDWEEAGIDLVVEDYSDTTVWKQVNLTEGPAATRAYVANSTIASSGPLTIAADGEQRIDAVVATASVAIAGGGQTGVGISAAGAFAENRISSVVSGFISGGVVSAESVTITADDGSAINGIAGAASIAGAFGGTTGVAVSVGLSAAFNEVAHDVSAYILNGDVDTTTGGVTVSATSSGEVLFELDLGQVPFTADDLDDAATSTADDPDTGDVDEGAQDRTADTAVLDALRNAFVNSGETLAVTDSVIPDALYSTGAGLVDLVEGDTVRIADGYGNGGKEGRVYRFVGSDETDVDLGQEDYTAGSRWELVTAELTLTTLVEGESWVLVDGSGATYLLHRTGDTVSVSRSTINAISAAASIAASFGGTTGVAVSGAGAFAANVILTGTNAFIGSSDIAAAGAVTIGAADTSTISSAVVAVSAGISGGGTGGVGVSIGASLAWNLIGSDIYGNSLPGQVRAYAENSDITADGDLTLTAVSSQAVNSMVLAGSVAVAAGGTVGVGVSGSGVWAENRIQTDVRAFIDGSAQISADSNHPGRPGRFSHQGPCRGGLRFPGLFRHGERIGEPGGVARAQRDPKPCGGLRGKRRSHGGDRRDHHHRCARDRRCVHLCLRSLDRSLRRTRGRFGERRRGRGDQCRPDRHRRLHRGKPCGERRGCHPQRG